MIINTKHNELFLEYMHKKSTYIGLLRGINVGGKRKIKMTDLILCLKNIGLKNVRTYIQSGNLIFQYDENKRQELEEKIQTAIYHHFSHEVPCIVRSKEEWKQMIDQNPFSANEDSSKLYLTICKNDCFPIQDLDSSRYLPDQFYCADKNIYLLLSNSYHTCKLSNAFFEKKLKTICTSRNWKTVLRLLHMAEE